MTQLPQSKKKRLWQKVWFWLLFILGICIILGIVFGMRSAQDKKKKSLSYLEQTVSVTARDLERTISATGTIAVDASQSLTALVSGTVRELHVAVGDIVTKDQLIFTIDSALPATSAQKEVRAPFDGRVLALNVFVGGSVAPGVPIGIIGYRSTHVAFVASDAEVVELEKGQKVHLTIPAVNNGRDVYDSVISFVDIQKTSTAQISSSPQATGGYVVHATAEALPEEIRNRIGLVIDLEIVTATTSQKLAVDRSAIQYDDNDNSFVYRAPELTDAFYAKAVAAENITDILEKVFVTTGFEGDNAFEIVTGLTLDEKVLLYVPKTTSTSPF